MTDNIRVNPRELDLSSKLRGDFELTEFEIAGSDCIILMVYLKMN